MAKKKWSKPIKVLLSIGMAAGLWMPTGATTAEAATTASDLFISEYIEGSSMNKAIELYNGTGAAVNLSSYSLSLYSNGSTSPQSKVNLAGTVANGETFVVYHGSAGTAIKAQGDLRSDSVINFNGDDALVLEKSGAAIDSVGQTGKLVNNLADLTLVRNAAVASGDRIINDAFTPSTQWTTYPTDTFSKLGAHVMNGSVTAPNGAPVATKSFANEQVQAGATLQYDLRNYFSDPEGQALSFTATKGTISGSTLTLKLAEGTHIVGVTASDGSQSITRSFSVTVTAATPSTDGYYATAAGLQGAALKAELHEIIDDHKQLSYSAVWDALKVTDEDPNNPNNVILLYTGESRSKSLNGGNIGNWNREHTWAKSHGDFGTSNGAGTDIHHVRPSDVQINGLRGNLDFDYGGSTVSGCTGCLRTPTSWEPPNNVKGDVARMLFYMAVRYEPGDPVDLELNNVLNNGTAPYHGKLSVLLQWHAQDPVSTWEKQRNEKIEDFQGNRNPFVDHPEWAESIW
ncbi:endonuclease [Planococcus glaciei]|uniref:endonuclease n=1 Tax=Planococcus glaciei TaxID=459472 RepID=UPI001FE566FA|nr:endonuclease [Planococcus glaciei]